jgi:cyclophilin family peptidyl-prolyl cis-trans isomerase
LRDHASRALATVQGKKVACAAPDEGATAAEELGRLVARAEKLTFATDAGNVTITLDPTLAPVAVTRVVELAKSGFYDGIVIHRVVPGFVVQFGDPDADGFGGPNRPALRCETSPVPFEPLRVGVALAGRDTGGSQLFVTLGTYPHLDGDFSLVGTAEGDWSAIAQGDVIRKVTVEP